MSPRTVALYAIGSLLGYAAALAGGFVSDDFQILESLRHGAGFITWAEHQGGFLRPVTIASLWLDLRILGGSAAWMHAENVLLHAWCACLVHVLASRMQAELGVEQRWFPQFAGLLFLLHPSHAEVVACIASRGDLLATALSLCGIVLGVDYLRDGRGARLAGIGAVWTAAVFAKESALAAPGMLAALAFAFRGSTRRRAMAPVAVGALVVGAWAIARYAAFGGLVAGGASEGRLDVTYGLVWSASKRQAFRTFVPALVPGDGWTLAFSGVVLVLLGATAFLLAGRVARNRLRRPPLSGILGLGAAYLCALVPVVGSKVQVDTGEGERFVYLASATAMIVVAAALAGARPVRAGRVVAAVWLVVCAALLVPAVARWRTAGLFVSRIVRTLVEESRGPRALVLNLPDSVEGAYVLRNGLAEAVGARRELEVQVVATFTADREGRGAEVAESAGRPGSWEVSIARRLPYAALRAPEITASVERNGGTRIVTADLSSFSDVFAFRNGYLERVGPPGEPAR